MQTKPVAVFNVLIDHMTQKTKLKIHIKKKKLIIIILLIIEV